VLAAARGDREHGTRLVERAAALSPRDLEVRLVLRRLRQGRPVDLPSLNRVIRERARRRDSEFR
jgi:hypothetical protein